MKVLSIEEFNLLLQKGYEIIDTRDIEIFKQGFIPGSINIPLHSKNFKDYVLPLFDKGQNLLIIAAPGEEDACLSALSNAGYNHISGFLASGFNAWRNNNMPIDMIIDVEADELLMDIPFDDKLIMIDVRQPIEFAEAHLKDAVNLPLAELADPVKISQFEEGDNIYLYCSIGIRSVIAASLLKKHGVHNLRNVAGGFTSIKEQPKVEIVKEPGMLN